MDLPDLAKGLIFSKAMSRILSDIYSNIFQNYSSRIEIINMGPIELKYFYDSKTHTYGKIEKVNNNFYMYCNYKKPAVVILNIHDKCIYTNTNRELIEIFMYLYLSIYKRFDFMKTNINNPKLNIIDYLSLKNDKVSYYMELKTKWSSMKNISNLLNKLYINKIKNFYER